MASFQENKFFSKKNSIMSYYSDKYQTKSNRVPNRMYAGTGCYFITVCTRNREEFFGEIKNGEMHLSQLGKEVLNQWLKTPEIRPDMNIKLDKRQVMPNHFHGIIVIGWNRYNSNYFTNTDFQDHGKAISLYNKFGPQSKNLGSVIRGFKSSVTTFARKNNLLFDWLPNYHDVVIMNETSLNKIRNYIANNVKNWGKNRFNRK